MSNGDQCCALEICCYWKKDQDTLATKIAAYTHLSTEQARGFLDWMAHEDLTFAPDSFAAVLEDIVRITRAHPETSH